MKAGRPIAFIVMAFVAGTAISQASSAFADDSTANPLKAIWDKIAELQNKTDSLQAQIDDLREQRGAASRTTEPAAAPASAAGVADPFIAVEAGSGGQQGHTLVQVIARNPGPGNAEGVKMTLYYQTSLFTVNSIQGAAGCTDGSRGIIECQLGSLDAGSEARVLVEETPFAPGQQAIFSADISSTTEDANQANNHAETAFFTTTLDAPAPVSQQQQAPAPSPPPQQQPEEQQQQQQQEQAKGGQEGQQVPADESQKKADGEQPGDQQPAEQSGSQSSEQSKDDSTSSSSSSQPTEEQGSNGGSQSADSSSSSGSEQTTEQRSGSEQGTTASATDTAAG
jgi:hypothetical protein